MMRLLVAVTLATLLIARTVPAALAEDCSCTARDGSCSASVSCPAGCIAVCPISGCSASCLAKTGGGGDEGGNLYAAQQSTLEQPVTLQLENSSSKALAATLARLSGKDVEFTPNRPGETFNLDIKKAPLWNVLEILSNSGKIKIGGEEFDRLRVIRAALSSNESISVCIRDAPVGAIVGRLAYLSGLPIRVTSGDARARVTASFKDITLEALVAQLSARSGTLIDMK